MRSLQLHSSTRSQRRVRTSGADHRAQGRSRNRLRPRRISRPASSQSRRTSHTVRFPRTGSTLTRTLLPESRSACLAASKRLAGRGASHAPEMPLPGHRLRCRLTAVDCGKMWTGHVGEARLLPDVSQALLRRGFTARSVSAWDYAGLDAFVGVSASCSIGGHGRLRITATKSCSRHCADAVLPSCNTVDARGRACIRAPTPRDAGAARMRRLGARLRRLL